MPFINIEVWKENYQMTKKQGVNMDLSDWLKQHEEILKHYNDFFSILGSIAAVIGIIVALSLLWATKQQISNTANYLHANTLYSIAKDGREIGKALLKGEEVEFSLVYNYLHSSWIQKHLGILDEFTWRPIENEICSFLRDFPDALAYWDEETKKYFHSDFVNYIEQVGKKPECRK